MWRAPISRAGTLSSARSLSRSSSSCPKGWCRARSAWGAGRRPGCAGAVAGRRRRPMRRVMTALALVDLEKSFGGLRVTAAVTLVIEPGERRLIIGPNGAGKTTLFNLITGELRPDSGAIRLFEKDITSLPSRQRAHLGIARTYQIITLFPGETLL